MNVLLLDIETSLHKVFTFNLIKAFIPPKQIIEPTRVLCYAFKWLGEKKIHFRDERDEDFIECIWDAINEADAIIHYNGAAFDMKHLNREFLLNKFPPPSSYTNIDLLKTIRKHFKFASNKLEYVSIAMGYEGKVEHRGVQLWIDCQEKQDEKAWKEMRRYNIRDVREMEPIYHDLLPWITKHPNWGHWIGDEKIVCRNCGSDKVKKDGWERKTVVPYQRYRCTECRTPLRGRTTIKEHNGERVPQPTTV